MENNAPCYDAEPLSGLTFEAMKQATVDDTRIAARVRMLQHRVVEELYDVELTFASVKGKGNYLCKDKIDEALDSGRIPQDEYTELSDWIDITNTGDKSVCDVYPEILKVGQWYPHLRMSAVVRSAPSTMSAMQTPTRALSSCTYW